MTGCIDGFRARFLSLEMSDLLWFVAHTKPRCEKKMVQYCQREGILTTLPVYKAVHKYRGKTVVFEKPLFPGYVFLQLRKDEQARIYKTDYLANLLKVTDQEVFAAQLGEVLFALDSGLAIELAPQIGEGSRVRIKRGPLRGMEAWVEQRYGMTTVLLRLDFIGQAAAVKVEADDLELF